MLNIIFRQRGEGRHILLVLLVQLCRPLVTTVDHFGSVADKRHQPFFVYFGRNATQVGADAILLKVVTRRTVLVKQFVSVLHR